jgi:lysyl-tRNA synthetase, class II
MASLDELRDVRLAKLQKLKEKGIDAYPSTTFATHTILKATEDFDKLSESGEVVTLDGRVMSIRAQGALIFLNFFDGTANFQALLKNEEDIKEAFELFLDTVDIGDFVEMAGTLFVTRTGQKTIQVSTWRMLTKTLLPLPEKWHGLQDADERFRKRYLDLLGNEEIREYFVKKAKFWKTARDFFNDKNFLEVETPTLEITTGGAEARPFKTHHNDFDIDVYLRISVGELWQKRLMAGGFARTFEIGKVYRNEGTSPDHLQEFTNLECYSAFMNLDEGKALVRDLYIKLAQEVFGKTEFTTRGHTFDLGKEWGEIDYVAEVQKQTGVNVLDSTEKEMEEALQKLNVKYDGKNRERMMDSLWKYCRKNISGPVFLVNHPKVVAPLSKENKEDPRKTEMFQVIIAGSEIGRAHAELNDPIDQAKRFEIQNKLISEGDEEAMMSDTEFVEMLEHGMPPVFGFGFGERFFSFLLDKPIRETQMFPLMKPQEK